MGTPILDYHPGGGVPIWVGPPPVIPPTPPAGSGISDSGITPLVIGQSYVDVVFNTPQANTYWMLVDDSVVNTIDASPLNIWGGIITSRTTTGFRLQLNGLPDTGNYLLEWAIAAGTAPSLPVATTYSFSGPTTGAIGSPKTYTVALPTGTTVSAPVTVTPSDVGGGGTFSPTTVTLTTAAPSVTFTYTPGTVGMKTLAVTNNGGLSDPSSIAFNATLYSTTYTLSQPSPDSGNIGTPSGNFTAALPVGGTLASPVTVTPNDGGAGGTFAPTSVTISTGTPSATFTYTPASYGVLFISVTNSGGLTDPIHATYASLASTYTLTGPSSGTVSTPSTNFTVALPAGGYLVSTVVVTPNDGGAGGTFTYVAHTLSIATPSFTFTYTPSSTGAKTISVTNSGGLTDPAPLTYTVGTGGLADGSPVSTWLDSSGNGHHATQTGSARPIFKTAILNGMPVVRFTTAGLSGLNLASTISGGTPFTCFAVMKATGPTVQCQSLTSNDTTTGFPVGPLNNSDGNTYGADRSGHWHVAANETTAWHVFAVSTDNSAGIDALFVDGTNATISSSSFVSTGNFAYIGWRGATGPPTYSDGDIAEIIFYNVRMDASSTNRANIEKGLGVKYGITVAGGTAINPDDAAVVAFLVGWWKADLGVS